MSHLKNKVQENTIHPYGTVEEISPKDDFYFQWHITERCNQRCAHCYHDRYTGERELDSTELLEVAERMLGAVEKWGRIGSFSLTGGEPFLRQKELFSIAKFLDDRDSVGYYDILTNGSLIGRETLTELPRLKKLRRVQLSLEGARPETNDMVRGRGSFAATLGAIQLLKETGLVVSVMTTLTKVNAHEIPALIDLLEGHGVDALAVERFVPEGQGKNMLDQALTKEEIKDVFKTIHQAGRLPRPMRMLMYRPLFCLLDQEDSTVGARCSVGTNALTVMHDGTVFPCRRLPIPLGNILHDGLYKIWYDSPVLWAIRNPQNLKGKCGRCDLVSLCRGCRAVAYVHSGDYLAEDPQCWA